MHAARVGDAFQILEAACLDSWAHHAGRRGIDDDEQDLHEARLCNVNASARQRLALSSWSIRTRSLALLRAATADLATVVHWRGRDVFG